MSSVVIRPLIQKVSASVKRALFPGIFALLSLVLASCHHTPLEPSPVYWLESTLLADYSNTVLKTLRTTHDSLVYTPGDFEVKVYQITYKTKVNSKPVIASGVIYVPKSIADTTKTFPLLSFQHATIYSQNDAPSGSHVITPSFSYPLYFATNGYVVLCPDYIGYGSASGVAHGYEHRETLAQASMDMLLATREFMTKKKMGHQNNVYLAGYSEGGYATLSLQKMIQDSGLKDISVTESSCGAGPYATQAFFEYLTENKTEGRLANYLYVWQTLTYNQMYDINKATSYYFKSPYAEQIAQSMTNAQKITASFDEICTDEFKKDIRDANSKFNNALKDNDISSWSPTSSLHLLHGNTDEYIPYLNTQKAYQAMKERNGKVSITSINKGTHIPTEIVFMRRTMEWFNAAKKRTSVAVQ